jgi:hypothetical protein
MILLFPLITNKGAVLLSLPRSTIDVSHKSFEKIVPIPSRPMGGDIHWFVYTPHTLHLLPFSDPLTPFPPSLRPGDADRILVNSEFTARTFRKTFTSITVKPSVLYPCVDPSQYAFNDQVGSFHAHFCLIPICNAILTSTNGR